jgi:hypothetical protein
VQNKTLTLESVDNFAYMKENYELIFAEVEIAVSYKILSFGEAIYLGRTNNITPKIFREAVSYMQNKTLTLERAIDFAYIKKND